MINANANAHCTAHRSTQLPAGGYPETPCGDVESEVTTQANTCAVGPSQTSPLFRNKRCFRYGGLVRNRMHEVPALARRLSDVER